ncbi:thioredoxin-like protein [Aspergillus unguis]
MASFLPRSSFRSLSMLPKAAPWSRTPISAPLTQPLRRFIGSLPREQPRLRLGATAPNFQAQTTQGEIDFHQWMDNCWTILFSHPADFTPVCTTELGAFAKLKGEFSKRGVKMIGLSANDIGSHDQWIKDINEVTSSDVQFPIIGDADRKVAWLYDMIDESELANLAEKGIAFTIRSVFIIDPAKKIRLTMSYPASTGRNSAEVLRVIDSLQTADKKGIATPINWQVGEDVIVPPSVSTEDAKKKFGEVRELKPYLRYTKY